MHISHNVKLSGHTFFESGGPAETFAVIDDTTEIEGVLRTCARPIWFLGDGANVLISDQGLPGTTLHLTTDTIAFNDSVVVADAGTEWDNLVEQTIKRGFWGLERTSGIPGSVGAAVVGNIAAYGQAVSDTLLWVEVIDTESSDFTIKRLVPDELGLAYRYSNFQKQSFQKYLVVRAAFDLEATPRPLEYASALKVAEELGLDVSDLQQRRKIILETRRRIGALIEGSERLRTAGSFFRNPTVSKTQAELITSFEEQNISLTEIKKQNKVHGGSAQRVSAAHVLLAAGFRRGQAWGPVRLHPDHILKIENTGGATSKQIYDVAQEIITTVKEKLGVTLEPEVRFLGDFT